MVLPAYLRSSSYLRLAISTALLASPFIASAQESSGDGGTVIYGADYFTEYAPISAQDMINRIPGLGEGGAPPGGFGGGNASSGGRGFGGGSSGSEILINGKRTAGKNNQTSELLSRISANQVTEIQIIRGTSSDLDVRGSSQVVNIVLAQELSSNSISYAASVDRNFDSTLRPSASAALSGSSDKLNYLFNLKANSSYNHSVSREHSVFGDFTPNDAVTEHRIRDRKTYEFSTNLGYDISSNSSIRGNALYSTQDGPTDVRRGIANVAVSPSVLTVELEDTPNKTDNWEIGGDYEYRTNSGSRFKLLAIANQLDSTSTRERFKLLDLNTAQKNLFLYTASVTDERILRSSYTMGLAPNHGIEFGAERAQTILDSNLALGVLSSIGTPSPATGGLVPQAVSNANSKVEEMRYEPFINYNWTINSKTKLETALLYESSTITQSGDVSNERDFSFVKPRIDLRYDMTPSWQLRGTIEKTVNQLSFSDFVAANDERDNDLATQAGNAQLRQQWQWKYNFRTEYRIPNDVGVLSADFFYNQHHDVIERIDVSSSPTKLQSANGNIGDGWEQGVNLTASIRMGMFNLPNLLVTSTLNVQDSEVTDPFLGIKRRFQSFQRGRFTTTFRHDIPALRANWGMQYFDRIDGGMSRYDIDNIEKALGEPSVNLFVEYIDRRGITYRFDANSLTNGLQFRDRYRYLGRTSAGILSEIETQNTAQGTSFSFKISGTF